MVANVSYLCSVKKSETVSTTKLRAGADMDALAPPGAFEQTGRTCWDFANSLRAPYVMLQMLQRAHASRNA